MCLYSWDYMINHDRYDLNRPWSRRKCSKNKKCLSKMMLLCIKQHLSNIWSSIYEKVKQHQLKKALLIRKSVYLFRVLSLRTSLLSQLFSIFYRKGKSVSTKDCIFTNSYRTFLLNKQIILFFDMKITLPKHISKTTSTHFHIYIRKHMTLIETSIELKLQLLSSIFPLKSAGPQKRCPLIRAIPSVFVLQNDTTSHFFKIWIMLHHVSVWRVQIKCTTLCFHLLLRHFFGAFHQRFCVFIVFISFLMMYRMSATEC